MKRDNGNGLSCIGVSPGLKSGRDAVESPAGLPWNQWPGWRGIADRDTVEWVAGITWNMQMPSNQTLHLSPDVSVTPLAYATAAPDTGRK